MSKPQVETVVVTYTQDEDSCGRIGVTEQSIRVETHDDGGRPESDE